VRLPFVRSYLLAAILLVPLAPTTSCGENDDYDRFACKVVTLLAPEIVPDEPGAAVVVTQQGKVIYRRCFGLANLEHRVPITQETVFDLASCAKQSSVLKSYGMGNSNDQSTVRIEWIDYIILISAAGLHCS